MPHRDLRPLVLCMMLASAVLAPAAQAQLTDDAAAVKSANQAFYAQLSALDLAELETLWAHEDYVVYIGPRSAAPVIGWSAVQAFMRDTAVGGFSQFSIKPLDARVHTNGSMAFAIGREQSEGTTKDGAKSSGINLVTNVFEKKAGRWLLVSHHAQRVPQ